MDDAPIPPPPGESATAEPSSLTDRLANVIAAPGEVFEELKNAPVRASNWLAPLILSCVATAIYIFVALSQGGVLRSIQEQQAKAMQKQIASGKITQAQADQATAMVERFTSP